MVAPQSTGQRERYEWPFVSLFVFQLFFSVQSSFLAFCLGQDQRALALSVSHKDCFASSTGTGSRV